MKMLVGLWMLVREAVRWRFPVDEPANPAFFAGASVVGAAIIMILAILAARWVDTP